MAKPIAALDALRKLPAPTGGTIYAVYGDDGFLKSEVIAAVRHAVLPEEDEFSLAEFSGAHAEWRDVADELSTVAMFGSGQRLVVVRQADDFVSKKSGYGEALEQYAARPSRLGVLVLEVKVWRTNTRLAKLLTDGAGFQIDCKTPTPASLQKWLTSRSKQHHGVPLEEAAARRMTEMLDPQPGLLDQELARLSLLVDEGEPITAKLVSDQVGGWRTRKVWDMIDAAAAGDAGEALLQLDRLIRSGEAPVALLAQIGSTLRRFAAASQLVEQAERAGRRPNLQHCLAEAGFPKFVLSKAESQMRQIGRGRTRQLHRWLLEADLALKGAMSSPSRARLVLEELIVKLARQTDPRNTRNQSRAVSR